MTITRSFGYTLAVPIEEQDSLIPKLHDIVCRNLNLCASVGCSCVTGAAVDQLCYESQAGLTRKILHSEGPTWSVSIRCLDNHVILDIHTTDDIVTLETYALYTELLTYPYPVFVHGRSHF